MEICRLCKYCGSKLVEKENENGYLFCFNHKNVEIRCVENYMIICDQKYTLYIFSKIKEMHLYDMCFLLKLPIDESLTPENFKQKIKTYMSFQ
jgi:hypothetical protein